MCTLIRNPVRANKDFMMPSASSASGSADRDSQSPSNKRRGTRQVRFAKAAPPVLISPQRDMASSLVEINGQLEDLMERIQKDVAGVQTREVKMRMQGMMADMRNKELR